MKPNLSPQKLPRYVAAVVAVVLGTCIGEGFAAGATQAGAVVANLTAALDGPAPDAAINAFQSLLQKNLAVPPLRFQFQVGDTRPSWGALILFEIAYRDFIAIPRFARASGSATAALDDATRRQASMKTMQYVALRNTNPVRDRAPRAGWLGRCLIAIIMDQAPNYCHEFSPYVDKLPLVTADMPRVVLRSAYAAAPGSAPAATAASRIDPNGPINNATVLQNSDVAIISAFMDTLKKLQKEQHGEDLYDYIATSGDPRTRHLALAVLADPDLSPEPAGALAFLMSSPKADGRARFFFIQKVIVDPSSVKDGIINTLASQLDDSTELALIIRQQVLTTLKTITSLDGIIQFDFMATIAKHALDPNEDPTIQAGCNDLLSYFISLLLKNKKRNEWTVTLAPVAAKINDQLISQTDTFPGLVGEDVRLKQGTRYLTFLVAVGQVIAANYAPNKVLRPLLDVFNDAKFHKKNANSRVQVAKILQYMGGPANTFEAYQTLQQALFQSTSDENAAILAALGAMTIPAKDDE